MSKVLVADDASFMRLMIRQILARKGYTDILEADNGLAAIELCKDNKPELIFLDITMPEMDGLTALARILEMEPSAKVIMCSAVAQENIVREALSIGAVDFIVKPFRPEDFLKTVNKYLKV